MVDADRALGRMGVGAVGLAEGVGDARIARQEEGEGGVRGEEELEM